MGRSPRLRATRPLAPAPESGHDPKRDSPPNGGQAETVAEAVRLSHRVMTRAARRSREPEASVSREERGSDHGRGGNLQGVFRSEAPEKSLLEVVEARVLAVGGVFGDECAVGLEAEDAFGGAADGF